MNTANRNGTTMSSAALMPAMMMTMAATVSRALLGRWGLSLNATFGDSLGWVARGGPARLPRDQWMQWQSRHRHRIQRRFVPTGQQRERARTIDDCDVHARRAVPVLSRTLGIR